jgi:hypothetical protein
MPRAVPSSGEGSEPSVPSAVLAVPIRLSDDGRFVTGDAAESLSGLIQIMFATSRQAWPHAPWFGLYETVSAPKPWGIDVQEALNVALRNLGVSWVSVRHVYDPEMGPTGERVFRMEFETADGREVEMREVTAG